MSGYIGPQPVPQATQHREAFTATASQTYFATVGYTPQFVDVYLNGVKLAAADYTATNGSDIVLTTGAALNDILEYVAYTPFEVASQTFTGTTTTEVLTVTGAFTSKGIDDNATSTAITIDASENVGIGTTPPTNATLHTYSNADNNYVAKFDQDHATGWGVLIDTDGTANDPALWVKNATNTIIWAAQSGNVGINVTDPIYPLEVQGEAGIELYNGTGGGSVLNFRPSLGDASKYNLSISSYDHSGGGVGPADGLSINGFDGVSFATGSNTTRQERMRITSAGSVGIGTSAPATQLHVSGSNWPARFSDDGTGYSLDIEHDTTLGITTLQQTNSGGDIRLQAGASSGVLLFEASGSERLRIDASGNLLVGKGVTSFNLAGVELRPVGTVIGTTANAAGLIANRTNSDGTLIQLSRGSTTVGGIGTAFGAAYIGTADTGLYFNGSSDAIIPYNPSGPSSRDNAIDLGVSGTRFKDLYLSGGVVFGTGGPAPITSNTLDDYEEGTWTPSLYRSSGGNVSATYGAQDGRYVKVGGIVHVYCQIIITALSSQGSGYSMVSGLPFTYSGPAYSTIGGVTSDLFSGTAISKAFPSTGSNNVYFGVDESTGFPPKQIAWSSSGNLRFSFTYYTTS